jgi:hypothetical protein
MEAFRQKGCASTPKPRSRRLRKPQFTACKKVRGARYGSEASGLTRPKSTPDAVMDLPARLNPVHPGIHGMVSLLTGPPGRDRLSDDPETLLRRGGALWLAGLLTPRARATARDRTHRAKRTLSPTAQNGPPSAARRRRLSITPLLGHINPYGPVCPRPGPSVIP